MAIYHFSAQIISRSNGSSSVGSSAYRSGEKIENERTGEVHDYTRKTGVEYTEILTPKNAPDWANDRAKLWNEVEKIEKSKNSQLAREINIALPKELSLDKQIELTRDFVKDTFVDKGMVADISIHDSKKGNPHAHIMLTMRPFDECGNWGAKAKKEYILDKKGEKIKLKSGEYKSRKIDAVDWNKKENLEKWREQWGNYANKSLEINGFEERIDHRTLEAQGIERVAQIHVGTHANAMEKRGVQSERGQLNKEIKELNSKLKDIDKESDNAISEFKEIKTKEQEKYSYLTHEEKQIVIKAENFIKVPLNNTNIELAINKLNDIRKQVAEETYKIKFESYSLKDEIELMKRWSNELKESQKELQDLPKGLFGGYKDKDRASTLKSNIERLNNALELRDYKGDETILEKEKRLKFVQDRLDKLNQNEINIGKGLGILNKANKVLELKERREFHDKYKDQFPQAKYLSVEDVRNINKVNEHCGRNVEIKEINKIYLDNKTEFIKEPTIGAKDILSVLEKAIKSIEKAKDYEEYEQRVAARKEERSKSKSKSKSRGWDMDR